MYNILIIDHRPFCSATRSKKQTHSLSKKYNTTWIGMNDGFLLDIYKKSRNETYIKIGNLFSSNNRTSKLFSLP